MLHSKPSALGAEQGAGFSAMAGCPYQVLGQVEDGVCVCGGGAEKAMALSTYGQS